MSDITVSVQRYEPGTECDKCRQKVEGYHVSLYGWARLIIPPPGVRPGSLEEQLGKEPSKIVDFCPDCLFELKKWLRL